MRAVQLGVIAFIFLILTSSSSCQGNIVRARIPQSADPVRLAEQLAPKPVWPPNFQKLIPTTNDAVLEESSSYNGEYLVRYRSTVDYYKISQFYIDELQSKGYLQVDDSSEFDSGDGVHYKNVDTNLPEFWVKIEKFSNCNRVIIKSALLVEHQRREQQKTTGDIE